MTLLDQIQREFQLLPPEKQSEALDFILFLRKQTANKTREKSSLRRHPAYGSWRGRNIDALEFQQRHRSEWNHRL